MLQLELNLAPLTRKSSAVFAFHQLASDRNIEILIPQRQTRPEVSNWTFSLTGHGHPPSDWCSVLSESLQKIPILSISLGHRAGKTLESSAIQIFANTKQSVTAIRSIFRNAGLRSRPRPHMQDMFVASAGKWSLLATITHFSTSAKPDAKSTTVGITINDGTAAY